MMPGQMSREFRFGAGRAGDQDRFRIGDRIAHALVEAVVQKGFATLGRYGVAMNLSRRTVGVEDHAIDSGPVEVEDLRLTVIDPHDRIIMIGHEAELAFEDFGPAAGRRPFALGFAKSTFGSCSPRKILGSVGIYSNGRAATSCDRHQRNFLI